MTNWLDMRPAAFGQPTATVAEPLFAAPDALGTPDLLTTYEEPETMSITTDQAVAPEQPAAYPAPGSEIPGQPGYVVSTCGHRVAGSEWRAGFQTCERCPDDNYDDADDHDQAADEEAAAPIASDRPEWARQFVKALRDAQADAAGELNYEEWSLIDAVVWSVRHRLGEKPRSGRGMSLGEMAAFLAGQAGKDMEAAL